MCDTSLLLFWVQLGQITTAERKVYNLTIWSYFSFYELGNYVSYVKIALVIAFVNSIAKEGYVNYVKAYW